MEINATNDLPESVDFSEPIDSNTMQLLNSDSQSYRKSGGKFFVFGALLGVMLLGASHFITVLYVHDLNNAHDSTAMLILLLIRGTLFGGLSVAVLYGVFSVGNAYVDQGTRFRKRLYSAHMLNYAFRTFEDRLKDTDSTVSIDDLVNVFNAWNSNVDSAFSRVKFRKNGPEISMSGRHANFYVGDKRHTNSDEDSKQRKQAEKD